MKNEIESLSLEDRLDALDLDWYIEQLLRRDLEGVVCRTAARAFLWKQQQGDVEQGIDVTARSLLCRALSRPNAASIAADNYMRLFHAMQPDELAQLIDASVPPLALAEHGKAVEALAAVEQRHAEEHGHAGNWGHVTGAAPVKDSAMPFSEFRQASTPRVPFGHLPAGVAERIAGESLRRTGYGKNHSIS